MYVPNPKVFGSDFIRINLPSEALSADNGSHKYTQDFRLTQTHWKAIDNENQPCDDKHTSIDENVNTTACIVDYLEKESNCSMVLKGSKSHSIR